MPINEKFNVEVKEAKGFEPLPENVYQVEVFDINVENRPTYDTKNKPDLEKVYEKVLNFDFVLLSGMDKDGKSLRGRIIGKNFVPTFLYISQKNGKNALYQIAEAILRHELTQEEIATMDSDFISTFIGSQLRVGVKQKKDGDKTYSNIESWFAVEELKIPLTHAEKDKVTEALETMRKGKTTTNITDNQNQSEGHDNIPTIQIDEDEINSMVDQLGIK